MDEATHAYGTLYIIATPIGNLGDITFRAVQTLKQVHLIAAEDTRHTRKLLSHYDIQNQLTSCHEHNERNKIPSILDHLTAGKDVALVSDAGTPCISDPGYQLVKAAAQKGILVLPIPGCCAAIAGLSVSGLATDSFLFLGFLPKKKNQRIEILERHQNATATLILYESPNRIQQLLADALQVLGNRQACLAREITKHYEEYTRGELTLIQAVLESKPVIKGECALLIQGQENMPEPITDISLEALILSEPALKTQSTSALARRLADEYHLSRKKVYDLIVALRKDTP